MHHRPTVLILAGRALTALITVWCLGCSAYEPLLDSLVGSGASAQMSCGPKMGVMKTALESQGGGSGSALPDSSAQAGYVCGCGSCHSVAPPSWGSAISTAPVPSA